MGMLGDVTEGCLSLRLGLESWLVCCLGSLQEN